MADFKLDANGDLDFSSNDLEIINGLEAVKQELQIRYKFFLGEWFLNPDEGVPYIRDVLKKNANETQVRALMREVAVTTPGVEKVNSLEFDLDTATRVLSVSMDIGANIDGELTYSQFVVEVEV